MKKLTTKQILTIIITLLTITVNTLANALPLNGRELGKSQTALQSTLCPQATYSQSGG